MSTDNANNKPPLKVDISSHRLSGEEREVCKQLVLKGEDYLRDELGWKYEQKTAFLEKKSVQRELERLTRLYNDRSQVQEKTIFFAQLEINKMVPESLRLLALALRGEYPDPRDATGATIISPPTDAQVRAALEVLDRSKIGGRAEWSAATAKPIIDARSVTVNIGDKSSDLDAVDSRERLRTFLDMVTRKLEKVGETVNAKKTPTEKTHKKFLPNKHTRDED